MNGDRRNCEIVSNGIVANGIVTNRFGVGIVWMLRMGSSRRRDRCEWDRRDGEIVANGIVANRFGVGIVCWDRSVLGSSRIGSLKLHFVVVYPSLMHIVQ